MTICPKCKYKNPDKLAVCDRCGFRIGKKRSFHNKICKCKKCKIKHYENRKIRKIK